MAATLEDGRLRLSGYVGDYYYEDGFTSADVVSALAQVDPDSVLTVHVNSPGGIATEGAAIHALLSARPGTTDIVVEGIAASAASLIAMAGATVTMSAGAVMMIHDPSGFTFGTAADHLKQLAGLEALATAYARVYADKSGKTVEECRQVMIDETWLTPEQAVEAGFADNTTERRAEAVAAFDYRAFAHAPKRLTALATKKKWSLPTMTAAPAAPNRQTEENPMSDAKPGGTESPEMKELRDKLATMEAEKADRERRDAIMALPEAKDKQDIAKALADGGMTAESAKAVLMVSAPAAPDDGQPSRVSYEASRAAGAGMNSGPPPSTMRVDIVANMKRRHAAKG